MCTNTVLKFDYKRSPGNARLKEAWNEEDIYDDLEPSLAGDLDHCSEFGQDPDPFGRAIFESLEPTTPPPRGGWMEEDAMRFQQGMM
eukprot:g15718.t1